jgi:2-iminobutanoate/2-iminopropanoate deaminase
MAEKMPVSNPRAPDMSSFFNWGLKLSKFDELFIVTGRPAWSADGKVLHPNDGVAQTKFILDDIDRFLRDAGYSRHDLIRIEYTFTTRVPTESYQPIFALFADWLKDVKVKPAASTLRIVESLALEGLVVEYEFWAAK